MNNESLCNMSVMDMLNNPVSITRLLTEMQSLLRNYGYADLAEVTAEFEIQLWGLKDKADDLGADITPLKNIWWRHGLGTLVSSGEQGVVQCG